MRELIGFDIDHTVISDLSSVKPPSYLDDPFDSSETATDAVIRTCLAAFPGMSNWLQPPLGRACSRSWATTESGSTPLRVFSVMWELHRSAIRAGSFDARTSVARARKRSASRFICGRT